MTSMLETIVPKSDQLNADDLIGGRTLTIKITKVGILAGDQPVSLSYEGDNGKPYKPGKSMRRVLVNIWGSDGNLYVGRSMTLYRDEKVKFGGEVVGGIRISHMSHISAPVTMALTTTRASRKPFTVQPLAIEEPLPLEAWISDIESALDIAAMEFKYKSAYRAFADKESRDKLVAAKDKKKAQLTINPEMTNGNTQ